MEFLFYFNVEPRQKDRPRFSMKSKRVYSTRKQDEYEYVLNSLARIQTNKIPDFKPFRGALMVSLSFVFERPKSVKVPFKTSRCDLDNLIKGIDAFNEVIWKDDAQIVEIHASKRYCDANIKRGVYMSVKALEPEKESCQLKKMTV